MAKVISNSLTCFLFASVFLQVFFIIQVKVRLGYVLDRDNLYKKTMTRPFNTFSARLKIGVKAGKKKSG
jgi:hypothetical protein